jgi:four helix bundle protein
MRIESYADLGVWQKGMDLAELCYVMTRSFPSDERFALTAQIRRAAVSIPANVAEGHGSLLSGRYAYHVAIARGSVKELETHVLLAQRLGYLTLADEFFRLTSEISRMLVTLRKRLLGAEKEE